MSHADEVREILCRVVLDHVGRASAFLTSQEQLVEAMRAAVLPECQVPIDVSPQVMQSDRVVSRYEHCGWHCGWHGGDANYPAPEGSP